jgi:putative Mg2+ transporter-C (MgtC) family protein
MPSWEMVLRLILAAGLGSVIGLERERLMWTAGLRTHMLVSVGACLMILVSAYGFNKVLGDHVVLDPSRVAAQVVSGIGFLGAGSIIMRNQMIKGLTTAASLWAVAGIGLAAGAGLYTAAVATTAIIMAILIGLKPLEQRYHAARSMLTLHLQAATGAMSIGLLESALGRRAGRVKQFVVRAGSEPQMDEVVLVLNRVSPADTADIIAALNAVGSIAEVREAGA